MGELMRIQGAFEFIIILGAVIALSTIVFGVYANIQKHTDTSIKLLIPESNVIQIHNTSNLSTKPSVDLYVPNILYVGKPTLIDSFFSGGYDSTVSDVYITATNAIVIPSKYSNIQIKGAYLLNFNIIPKKSGIVDVELRANVISKNTNKYFFNTTESYAINQPLTNGSLYKKYSVNIKNENESLVYGSKLNSALYNITELSHCAKTNWWGNLLPINLQCGGASWDYFIESAECYYGKGTRYRAYCVYQNSEKSNLYTINKNPKYNYNITVRLWNSSILLTSKLNNKKNNSILVSANNSEYGNVIVSNYISGYGAPLYSYLISYDINKSRPVNSSLYTKYSQALNNLNSVLEYYNGKIVGGAAGTSISENINSYDSATRDILNSKNLISRCNLLTDNSLWVYVCPPYSAFQFSNITVFIKGYNNSETVDFQGSSVNIR